MKYISELGVGWSIELLTIDDLTEIGLILTLTIVVDEFCLVDVVSCAGNWVVGLCILGFSVVFIVTYEILVGTSSESFISIYTHYI